MTDKRPELNRNIPLNDFNDFYWLKEELTTFCRQHGISAAGGKPELAERIAAYLQAGETVKPLPRDKITSRFDWNSETLTPETLITDSYKNTENVRAFFAKAIGAHFKFNVLFCNWMKQNAGKRLNDAVVEWNRISVLKKDNSYESEIGTQFEYNTYMRDFLKDNPELSFRNARKYWMLKKQTRGSKKYTKEDLLLNGIQP
ncbi:MAG: SAP domain-containing protein [Bacteroidales bacterium]|jgi:hypothetical protein|nr:SAP domain-containing protein [Bacteroidales bacterium]